MLTLRIESREFFDEDKEEFVFLPEQKLVLEHSLLSISKWEAKWKKPFMNTKMTQQEYIDYIRCMTVGQKINPLVYNQITVEQLDKIRKYIDDPMTATTIKTATKHKRGRNTTSELIYCWMFTLNIPIECEKWHLNRLLTLIDVCSIENNPKKKKMSRRDIYSQNAAINAARRAKYHTKG